MEKSFTDYCVEAEELSQGNELIRAFLLDNFFKNIPEHINKKNKSVLNQFFFALKRKEEWQCGHENCEVESCYSHEVSENVFLKYLTNIHPNTVVIMERDISGNALFYYEKEVHKRNASNFPGYCSEHDSNLFSDIENGVPSLNDHFVNKQCLRSIRRKKFDLLLQLRGAEIFLSEVDTNLRGSHVIELIVKHFERKKEALLEKVSILSEVYDKVYAGIIRKNYLIKHKELGQPKQGYCFSEITDFTEENDTEECILFWFKMDFSTDPKAFICWLDNETSEKMAIEISRHYKFRFVELMYDKKEKLVFSSVFLNQMDEDMKKTFLQDSDFYNLNGSEVGILTQEFF